METDKNNAEETSKRIRKRKTPRHMSNIDLRPCEVCGGKSSGFHFGAITCEACKSFFRRTIKSDITYSCFRQEENEPCVLRLVKGGIAPCPACRWKRCQELNMSADAVKKGRYTHSKKAEAINISRKYWDAKSSTSQNSEVTSENGESLSPAPSTSTSAASPSFPSSNSASSVSSNRSLSASSSLASMSSEDGEPETDFTFDLGDVLEKFDVEKDPCPCSLNLNCEDRQKFQAALHKNPDVNTIQSPSQCAEMELDSTQLTYGTIDDLDREEHAMPYCSQSPEIERELTRETLGCSVPLMNIFNPDSPDEHAQLSKVIEAVTTAYDHQNFLTKSFLSKVSWLQYKHMKEREVNTELLGNLPVLPVEDHKKLLDETGIDIDGRLESLQGFCCGLESGVQKFISYMKGIPGFQLMSMRDQVSMVRKTNAVLMETVYYACHNLESGVIANPFQSGRSCIDHHHKTSLIGRDRCDYMRPIIKLLQDLDLTDQENALMSSVCAMHPDACATDDGRNKCQIIHSKLHKALRKLLCRRCDEKEATRILHIIEHDIREDLHKTGVPNFSHQWLKVMTRFHESVKVPALVLEWFNID